MIKLNLIVTTINWVDGSFYVLADKTSFAKDGIWNPYSVELTSPEDPISAVGKLLNKVALIDKQWSNIKILNAEFNDQQQMEITYCCNIPYDVDIAIEENEWINVSETVISQSSMYDQITESIRSIN